MDDVFGDGEIEAINDGEDIDLEDEVWRRNLCPFFLKQLLRIKEITQEDAWIVIDCYFEENGLVKQQIDSFDEFITNTIGELIEDAGEIVATPGQ